MYGFTLYYQCYVTSTTELPSCFPVGSRPAQPWTRAPWSPTSMNEMLDVSSKCSVQPMGFVVFLALALGRYTCTSTPLLTNLLTAYGTGYDCRFLMPRGNHSSFRSGEC